MNSITLEQNRTVINTNGITQYQVNNEIIATESIPLSLFVNRVEPDEYSHIATITDISCYPADRNEAINLGLDFYRRPDAIKIYSLISDAIYFALVIREQMAYLISTYPLVETEFIGHDTFVFNDT